MAALLLLVTACGDDSGDAPSDASSNEAAPSLTSSYERYVAIADSLGCQVPPEQEWKVTESCEQPAITWLDCVARDTDQCYCESDGDLNCEGSFKPSEGAALCIDEFTVLNACS